MDLGSAILQALEALFVHKSRSALTSLGIVIGIGAVIAMVSAGSGARRKLDERLESSGRNMILVRPGSRSGMGMGSDITPLTTADAEAIRREAGSMLVGVAPLQVAERQATAGRSHCTTVLTGTWPDLKPVGSWRLTYGRMFDDRDLRRAANVCVMGQTTRIKLFGDRANVVGENIQVNIGTGAGQLRLTIVGVMAEKGQTPLGVDQDDQIFLPLTTLQRKIVGRETIPMILTTAKSESELDQAEQAVERAMRTQHRLRAEQYDDFDVSSVKELSQLAVVISKTLQLLIAAIASISLVVGGIGIMNVMLVSVTERTREIGVRMSIGATPTDVMLQFLLEAVVLALVGGVLGIIAGLGVAVALAYVANWPLVISPAVVLLAFAVTAGVGIFFGYYPAWKASRLDPIVALRYE